MDSYEYKTGTFIGNGSTEIFFRHWQASRQKGILVISHGIGEHSGRYNNIVNELEGKSNCEVNTLEELNVKISSGSYIDTYIDKSNGVPYMRVGNIKPFTIDEQGRSLVFVSKDSLFETFPMRMSETTSSGNSSKRIKVCRDRS